MPWTFVKGTTGPVVSGLSASASFATNVSAGNALVAWAVDKTSASLATPTFSDDTPGGADVWHAVPALGIPGSVLGTVSFGWAVAAGGNAPTVTVTWGGSAGTLEMYVAEFVPPVAISALAVDAGPSGASGSGTTWSGPALTLAGASDLGLVMSVFAVNWSTTTAPWTSLGSAQGDEAGYALNQSGTTTPSGTNASGSWGSVAAALSPVAAVPQQSVLPDADVTTTGWTTTPLFSKVNDASDTTFVTATLA